MFAGGWSGLTGGFGAVGYFRKNSCNKLRAALFIFLALFWDLLRYLVGTVIWFLYFRHKEKQGTSEKHEFLAPEKLTWPTCALFYLKSATMLVAEPTRKSQMMAIPARLSRRTISLALPDSVS